jgi:hypothetical protein
MVVSHNKEEEKKREKANPLATFFFIYLAYVSFVRFGLSRVRVLHVILIHLSFIFSTLYYTLL